MNTVSMATEGTTQYQPSVAIVTGATSGFAHAIARLFVKQGILVVAVGRRAAKLHMLQRELGERLHPVVMDVRDAEQVAESFGALPLEFRNVDVLVNNAGLSRGLEPAHKAKLSEWNEMVDTNCKGVLNCTHATLPGMVERQRGHIVNLGSVAAEFPYPGGNVYGASKAFVQQFSLNLRADLLGTPIRVTDIEPGLCSGTEFSLVRFRGDATKAAEVSKGVHALSAEDVAQAVYWSVTLPPHVNINLVQMMPVQQAFGPFAVHRLSSDS
jgi:3-hydroxy acid dehydrogenase/malonic semialdehyde reductase